MKIWKTLFPVILSAFLFVSVSAAAQAPVALDLQPGGKNPASPVMGDHLQFWSTITNTGTSPIEGLVAWISLVEIDPGNEQPVDLEDWSAHKAVTGASLKPGQSLRTDWHMRLIKGGDYRVVVSVTDFRQCGACCNLLFTCPMLTKQGRCYVYGYCRPRACKVFPIDQRDIDEATICGGWENEH